MPRFFFHLYEDVVSGDTEGMVLPDREAARKEAVKAARELAAQQVRDGELDLKHRIEVMDEDGDLVLSLPFGSAFKIR